MQAKTKAWVTRSLQRVLALFVCFLFNGAGGWRLLAAGFFLLGSLRRGFSHRESKKCGMAEYGIGLVLFDFHFRLKRLAAFPC